MQWPVVLHVGTCNEHWCDRHDGGSAVVMGVDVLRLWEA